MLLRPMRPDEDAEALLEVLSDPTVVEWWGRYDEASFRTEVEEVPVNYAAVIDGAVQGWLQCHEETDPDYLQVAFDIVLGPKVQGQGYGQEVLRVAIRHYMDKGHHRFTIDPAVGNEPAIRCYTAVGFKPVGVLRKAERALDGTWRDGLLMDLLAEEFDA